MLLAEHMGHGWVIQLQSRTSPVHCQEDVLMTVEIGLIGHRHIFLSLCSLVHKRVAAPLGTSLAL